MWATEGAGFVSALKTQTLGYSSLSAVDYHLNMTVGQSDLARTQEPTAIFELSLKHPTIANLVPKIEKLPLEFSHQELYSFFADIERIQQQLDGLNAST